MPDPTDLDLSQELWIAAAAFILIAAVSAFAERRRHRRRDIERPGWMPWHLIQFLAFFAAFIAAALALKL